jgi:hypothetical protein
MYGSGTNKCTEGDCSVFFPTDDAGDFDYTHRVSGGLGAELLWKLGSLVRLGPGLFFVLPSEVDFEQGGRSEIGSDLSLDVIFELAPRVGAAVWLVPRAQVGGTLLFPTGDMKAFLSDMENACFDRGDSGCGSISGARPGVNGGLGFGVLSTASEFVRLRADLLAQIYWVSLYSADAPASFGGTPVSRTVSGSRFFLIGGLEFP